MEFQVLAADDWQLLRDVRLQALKDSPGAYISNYETEASWTEASWRRSFADALWVVLRNSRRIIGLARSLRVDGRPPDERHLEAVWVEPRHRRTGVMRALLVYLTELEPDVHDWLLWVLDHNAEALEAYERLGFEPTGERQQLTDASGRTEVRFRRSALSIP
ncbi:GNAT family N-acetyltransferase [Kribbella sp. NPDC051620]|uniref:GNAT family N-acetyltransferase n=1 Tax=Kribbella sp. NPDC051620 TaxID=3364120 RepID=UPI0037BC4963